MRLKSVCTFRLLRWLDEGIEDDDQDLPTFRASSKTRQKLGYNITHRHKGNDYVIGSLQTLVMDELEPILQHVLPNPRRITSSISSRGGG